MDKYGNYVVKMEKIKKKYLQNKKNLAFDILSNVPFDWISLAVPGHLKFQTLSVIRLNRLLRLKYIFDYHAVKSRNLMVNKIYLEIR